MKTVKHFNSIFKESKYGWNLSREKYIPTLTESSKAMFENDKEIAKYIDDCLNNFDLNMSFFKKLDKNDFNNELNIFLNKHKEFTELLNLDETKDKSGYYIMVLDNFKQIYIGTGKNIYKRLRKHMSENQEFCNLLWGDVDQSKLSINSFRPLDTTRIFVYYTNNIYTNEDNFINDFNDDYILNRTTGGILNQGFYDAISGAKLRTLK